MKKVFLKSSFVNDPLLYLFIAIALCVRIIFWLYTGRIWEDYLITITAVENAWNGFGLTHHVSEPRVHSFTSPLSVLIPLCLMPLMDGLLSMRLVSLVATVGVIYIAYKICRILDFKSLATSFVLAFLSFDFLHIFFGMSGMETQVGVFFLLMAMRYFLEIYNEKQSVERTQILLGIALGFCMLSRPDFVLPCICIGAWLLFTRPKCLPKIILVALIIYLPWIIFTTIYYGSPIPNTIIAKSAGSGLMFDVKNLLPYIGKLYAPMYEWVWIRDTNLFLKFICSACFTIEFLLLSIGTIYGTIKDKKFILFAIVFGTFALYNKLLVYNAYYMWYLPPFTAIAAILVAAGLNSLFTKFKRIAISLSIIVIGLYIIPLPSLFYLEKQAQEVIEDGVRKKVGEKLAILMDDDDSVIFEPLGYLGYYARNKTIYDCPGLGSKISVQSLKKSSLYRGLNQLCYDLKPTFVVLRPAEYDDMRQTISDFDTNYNLIETIESPIYEFHSGFLSTNHEGDSCFMIFKRKQNE